MKRFAASILLGLVMGATGMAEVLWLETSYDFGTIKEADGPKKGRVRFVNLTEEPVVILEARPSCGCTTSNFTEVPVEKGDTAVISFVFDPYKRPGPIEKSIRVRLSGGKLYRIPLTGSVLGTPESLENIYPVDAGPIRLSESRIFGGNVTKGKMPSHFLHCYNQTEHPVTITISTGDPALKAELADPVIEPGRAAVIMVTFDSKGIEKGGDISIPITVAGDDANPYTLNYTANLVIPSMVIKKK